MTLLPNRSFTPAILSGGAVLCLAVLTLWVAGCNGDQTRDVRDYYFPVRSLDEGLVYEYRAIADTLAGPNYWYYRAIKTDSAIYLAGAYYETDFTPTQIVREELVSNGMLLNDLFLFEPDTSGKQQQIKAEILSANVFPFTVRDSNDIYLYKVRFQMPSQQHGATTLIVNRRFMGDTSVVFQGKTYNAIRFALKGVAEVRDSVNGDIEPAFTGHEIYAHKIGLFSYRRNYGGAVLQYQLHDRYPMTQLEEMSRKTLEKK